MPQTLPVIADSEPCSCPSCISMCRRPCWPTPDDVRALISAGEAGKLMLDYWIGDFSGYVHERRTYVVCPANPGYEGRLASDYGFEFLGCTFQKNDLCELHERGLKPTEGRAAHHEREQPDLHGSVARYWDTDDGREVIAIWCGLVGIDNPYMEDEW